MSHASSREKALLQIKRVRKQQKKKKLAKALEQADMTDAEKNALHAPIVRTLKEITDMQVWDYEHNQLPPMLKDQFKTNLNNRMLEVLDEHAKATTDLIRLHKHKEYTKLKEIYDKVK